MRGFYFVLFFILSYSNTFCSSQEKKKNTDEYMRVIKCNAHYYFSKYVKKENCNFLDFIVKGHTRSSLHYYTWATIDTILRQFLGVVWIYKKGKYFEFYYGSVIGIGWYPQCLNFNKYFRIGFFDIFVNLISLATTLCNLFLTRRILREKDDYFSNNCIRDIRERFKVCVEEVQQRVKNDIYYTFLDYTPACNYIRKLNWFELSRLVFALLMSTINFSFINLQMFSGFIRVKFLTFYRICMCFKDDLCCIFANILPEEGSEIYAYTHAVAGLPIFFRKFKNIFFPGKIGTFLLILQLVIPNIEINISTLH